MIDVILVIIFLIICYLSYKRGFVATFLTIVSGIFSLIVVYALASPVAGWLKDSGLFDGFTNSVRDSVAGKLGETGGSIVGALTGIGLPGPWSDRIAAESAASSLSAATYVAERLTELLAGVLAIVLLFVFLQIVVRFFLKRIAKGINKIPIVGTVNRISGLLLGGLWGLLLIYLVSLLISALSPAVPLFGEWMNQSSVLKYMAQTPLFMRAYDAIASKPK